MGALFAKKFDGRLPCALRNLISLFLAEVLLTSLHALAAPAFGYQIVAQYPHSIKSYTEGFLYLDGLFYEGTGLKATPPSSQPNPKQEDHCVPSVAVPILRRSHRRLGTDPLPMDMEVLHLFRLRPLHPQIRQNAQLLWRRLGNNSD